jgi:hypothetical protein
MPKFGRKFTLKIETSGGENVEISSPFTLEFSVTRSNMASANSANFVIYNLNEKVRNKIFKDQFDVSTYRAVQLFAGYEGGIIPALPRVFNGNIRSAYSFRNGPNFKTELDCYDGGFSMANGFVSQTLPAGTPQVGIIRVLMDALPKAGEKVIGNSFLDQAKRGIVLFGNPAELLKQYTNGGFYMDNQNAYALDTNEVVVGELNEIDSSTGLLETPRRGEASLELNMLFEPRLKISQLVVLNSDTAKNFNGTYKVVGVSHRGIISDAVGGECRTSVTLLAGNAFRPVVG